jgi:hypothetical protein
LNINGYSDDRKQGIRIAKFFQLTRESTKEQKGEGREGVSFGEDYSSTPGLKFFLIRPISRSHSTKSWPPQAQHPDHDSPFSKPVKACSSRFLLDLLLLRSWCSINTLKRTSSPVHKKCLQHLEAPEQCCSHHGAIARTIQVWKYLNTVGKPHTTRGLD